MSKLIAIRLPDKLAALMEGKSITHTVTAALRVYLMNESPGVATIRAGDQLGIETHNQMVSQPPEAYIAGRLEHAINCTCYTCKPPKGGQK